MLRILVPTCLVALLSAPAVAAPPTPEALVAAVDAASRGGDQAALDALITDDFRYAPTESDGSGERLVRELVRRRPPVRAVGVRTERRRSALTVSIGEKTRVVLAAGAKDGWRIDGLAFTPEAAAAYLAGNPTRPPRDERLLLAGGALAAALVEGDTAAAEGWMTPAFVAAPRDGGRRLITQVAGKGLGVLPRDARAVGNVGVLTADITQGGRVADRIYLLATRQPDATWRFEAITENRDRVRATLDGQVPPRFEPRALPSEPGAESLVGLLQATLRAGDPGAAASMLGPEVPRTPGIGLPRARGWLRDIAARVTVISPAAVHVDRASGRGAARMVLRLKRDEKGPIDETVWLYLRRVDGRWTIADLNYGLTERWFYPGPSDR